MYRALDAIATRTGLPALLLIAAGLLFGSFATPRAAAAVPAVQEGRTRIVLLGTGTPNADPERSGPSLAIVVDSVPYIVDAGPGLVRRAAAAAQNGVTGLEASRLATLFLTHLHSDHTTGLADIFLTPWTLEREVPLRLIGPEGTERMAYHIREAYQADIQNRLYGSEPANNGGHRIDASDVQPGIVFQDERVTVTAFEVNHGSWPQAFGYRFETPDRVIVVSGDAAPSESIVEMCNGCDVLIHEVYAKAGWDRRDAAWQAYHAASHTSGIELGELAARARPGLLLLTHHLLWGATPQELMAEVAAGFSGRVIMGDDLGIY